MSITATKSRYAVLQIEAAPNANVELKYFLGYRYRFPIMLVLENGDRVPYFSELMNSYNDAAKALEDLIAQPDELPPGHMTYDTSTASITTRYWH